ncbi:MAG: hypothetical protein B9S32_08120 [Verrucomicrobia bacterium Tous-C9LFEB]|nr:MAG: hypothetical protein B9S32_08120 [Verrucomicrobia bacterium Tous-C9LFEB]
MAVFVTLATLGVRLMFSDWFASRPVLILFLIPIILSSYLGGLGPGMVSTLLSGLVTDFYFIPPVGSLAFARFVDFTQWFILLVAGTLISLLNERLHRLRRQAEILALKSQQAEERFRQLAEALPQMVWTTDAEGVCEYMSPQWLEYTGATMESQLGLGWIEVIHPDDRARTLEEKDRALADKNGFRVEYRIRRHDGHYRWFDTRAMPLRDETGRIIKWIGSSTDIQEQREVQEELRRGEQRFRTVVETGPDAIFIQTRGCFAYLNPTAVRLFGAVNAEQLIGQPVLDHFHPDYREGVRQRIQQLNQEQKEAPLITEQIVRCNGEAVDVEVSAVPFIYKGEHGALVFARDITLRKKVEQQLLLRGSALKAAANSIVILDKRGTIIWINPAFTKLTGYEEAEALGQSLRLTWPDPGDDVFYSAMWETVLAGNVWHGELLSRRKDGSLYTQEMTITPVYDEGHRISHFIAVKQDISDRKKAEEERKKLEGQLLQAQKLEAIGRFSGGIAHDFNNILAAVAGNARISLDELPPVHPAREYIGEIEKSVVRARDLVRRLLTFTRQEESVRVPIELPLVIEEAVKMLRPLLPAMIEIRTHCNGEIPKVNADATQIHQIIMNLGTNAMHAMADTGGVLSLDLETVTLDASHAKLAPELYEGRFVRLMVRDTGCGMDQSTAEHIFEPFFTTKGVGEGSGLGLSMVHGIMKSHHGAITVYSQAGRGTVFRLYFPAMESATESKAMPPTPLPYGHGEHVIYVDDEKPLVFVSMKIIEKLGYKVSGFSNPMEALDCFRANPSGYDAIVSDCSMPGMSGYNLVKSLREIRPDFPAALASGYVREQDMDAARKVGVTHFIAKPSTIDELANVLHQLLASKTV